MSVDIDALERQLDGMIRKIDAELGKAKHRVVVEHDDGAGNGFGDGDSNPSLDASEADDYNGEANGDLEDEEDDGEDEDDIGKASVDAFLRTHDESNRPGALAFSKHPPNRHKFEALTDKIKNEEGVPKSQALALARMR